MRLRVGPADVPRPARACWPGSRRAGCEICVWINPYIAQRSPLFARGQGQGLPAAAGPAATCGRGTAGSRAWPSSTSPTPRPATGTRPSCSALLDDGRGLLQDRLRRAHPGRRGLLTTAPTRSGCTTTTPTSTTRPSSSCSSKNRGEGEASSFARSAHGRASSSRCTGAATAESTFESMAESLRGGLSLGLSGFGFWSHDIGGFEGTAGPGPVQALGRVRPAVLAQPAARQRVLPRAVAVRRGGGATCCASSPSSSAG